MMSFQYADKQEFKSQKALAYSVFNRSKNQCLGSVYIDPSRSSDYDCEVYLWVRDDSIALDKVLYHTVLIGFKRYGLFLRSYFQKEEFHGNNGGVKNDFIKHNGCYWLSRNRVYRPR